MTQGAVKIGKRHDCPKIQQTVIMPKNKRYSQLNLLQHLTLVWDVGNTGY